MGSSLMIRVVEMQRKKREKSSKKMRSSTSHLGSRTSQSMPGLMFYLRYFIYTCVFLFLAGWLERNTATRALIVSSDILTEKFNALATDSPSWTLVEISSRHQLTGNRQTMEFPAAAISVAVALFILFASTAVYSAQDFDIASQLRSKSSNAAGLCANVIEPSGFPCTEHTTRTKDGYVLGLQRVTSHSVAVHKGAPPVLLIHGLFMGGDAWFLDSPNQSLGFILANRGYDVWVGNVRGTRWSHGHVSLSEEDKDFWDWSWQELALHDLGEMIHYIYSTTNSEVLVVGHSQGTIMSLAALTQPYIAKMVKAAALLCPISYLDHITAPFVLKLVKMRLDEIILALGIHELNFKSEWGTRIMDMMCDGHLDCADMLSSVTGLRFLQTLLHLFMSIQSLAPRQLVSSEKVGCVEVISQCYLYLIILTLTKSRISSGENCCFNSSRIDSYLEYEPHPSSSKNLHHLFQSMRFCSIFILLLRYCIFLNKIS
ncbi:hypothetical protein SASPL_134222 [Salvia splendens]|uniref:Partial AB-hydrolase lipase domain-containing protein n=1 Tax=Salvia splendens TaxID=180675 RepID=A0A8X8ZJ40_SALSN|nr:hypothetical protein SASPL_134222 [Salvia splendens]